MPEKTIAGLTRQDVATLADGTGGISDEAAGRLADLIRNDPRFVDAICRLRQMADDAGAEYLADGLKIHQLVTRLRKESWKKPREVVHPALDVPYPQLLAMVGSLAQRARGRDKTELTALSEHLIIAFSSEVADEPFFRSLVERLMAFEERAAEQALHHLVGHYRRLREQRASSGVEGGKQEVAAVAGAAGRQEDGEAR